MATATVAKSVLSERIGRIEVSATMAITAEALRLKSTGIDLADFGAGEPHFETPRHIKDAAIAAINQGFTRYTAVAGTPDVRKAICARHAEDFGTGYAPDECVFTTGGKLALFNALQVMVDHGDEVVLPVPYWVSYKDIIQYAGGVVKYVECDERGKLPRDRGNDRSGPDGEDQGHHPVLAVESFGGRDGAGRCALHCAAGA